MIYLDENIEQEEFDAFVRQNAYGSVLQSYDWGRIKQEWQSHHLGIREEQQLIGTLLVLERKLYGVFKILYIPRGLVVSSYENPQQLAEIVKLLKQFGKKRHALFLKFDPLVVAESGTSKELTPLQPVYDFTRKEIANLSQLSQVEWLKDALDIDDTLQPRYQAVVYDTAPYNESSLNKKGRYYVKTARNRGVVVTKHGVEALDDFVAVLNKTEDRQNIKLRNKAYFQLLLETYSEAFIMLGSINFKKRLDQVTAEIAQLESDYEASREKSPKKAKRLEEELVGKRKELTEVTERVAVHGEEDIVISGALSVPFGDTNELLYAGMDDAFSYYVPAYLTWYESILEGFALGCKKCNLGGIHATMNDGLIKYKNHFSPVIEVYMGEFDIPMNKPLYKLAMFGQKVLKKIRS